MASMTPRERTLKALAFEETDIVPYQIDIDDVVVPRLAAYYGAPDFRRQIINHLPVHAIAPIRLRMPGDSYVDDFGCRWRLGEIFHLEDFPLKTPSLSGYRMPDLTKDVYYAGVNAFLAANSDRLTLCGLNHLYYSRAWSLRGVENLFMDFVENPSFVEELFEMLTDLLLSIVERASTFRFDGIRLADDFGYQRGVIMGAARWRKFIKPGIKRIFERARKRNLIVMLHSCGDVTEIVPDLIDMGLQILNPLQPEAMDILDIKRRYGQYLTLNGGISTQQTLPQGTAGDVRAEVGACLRYLGKGGGYIVGPAKPIMADVPVENAVALIDAIVNQTAHQGIEQRAALPERVEPLWRVYSAFHV